MYKKCKYKFDNIIVITQKGNTKSHNQSDFDSRVAFDKGQL